MDCPSCGKKQWAVPDDDSVKQWIYATDYQASSPMTLPQRYIPIVWMLCTNCGYIASFSKKFVDRWVSRRETKSGE